MTKPNAIYIMGGGGTAVVSASAYGLIAKTFTDYRRKIGTFYAAVGGIRGAINEDITDVFRWAEQDGISSAESRLKRLQFYSAPVFRTSRHKPNDQDCQRMLDVFRAHNIYYVFFNGGNDTMEKVIILQQFAKERGYEIHIIGIPKTVDNDLLETHRCPGYATFAKQVAISTMSLQGDLDAFTIPPTAVHGGPIKEGGNAQVVIFMGRDYGWGSAASVVGKLDESYGPHVILTKEGGFSLDAFLARCQNAWDNYGNLLVVASEGAHDGTDFLANRVKIEVPDLGLDFKYHEDPHQNTSVTDSRLGLFLKLLLEGRLGIQTDVFKSFKTREEGPGYLDRNHQEILSAKDCLDAVAVGERAADLAFGETPLDGVMVTLRKGVEETGYTELEKVADPSRGSKAMTKPLTALDTPKATIITPDGMMIDRDLFMAYIRHVIDLNGPNRSEFFRGEGYELPLLRIDWPLEDRLLPHYEK